MKPGIREKMDIKQVTLLLMIFSSLVLASSSSKILYPEKQHTGRYSVAHISTTGHSAGHGGSSGGSAGGGKGRSGGVSQGDTGSDTRNPAGAANVNHHHRGASIRVQSSVFFTWVVAIFATQFCTQVL